MEINHIKIFGERNTGTNLLKSLISENIGKIVVPSVAEELHPNWPVFLESVSAFADPVRGLILDCMIDDLFSTAPAEHAWKHSCPAYNSAFVEKGIGVIFLIKDPYSWAASLHRNPYHIRYLRPESFSTFIRHPWPTVRRDNLAAVLSTPLHLWNQKLTGYCAFAARACDAGLPNIFVHAEDLIADQFAILRRIRTVFGIEGECEIETRHNVKLAHEQEKTTEYYKKFYSSRAWVSAYSSDDAAFANEQFDSNLLIRFGYEPLSLTASASSLADQLA